MKTTGTVLLSILLVIAFPAGRTAAADYAVRPVVRNPLNNSISALCCDNDGFMWVGTVQGLMRFDAYTYKTFTGERYDSLAVSQGFIRTIYKDAGGNLWIGTDLGASVRMASSNTFHNLYGGIENRSVNGFCTVPDGRIVAATSRGAALVDPATLEVEFIRDTMQQRRLMRDNIQSVAVDSHGGVWLGGLDGMHHIAFGPGAQPEITSWMGKRQAGFLAIDSLDRIWSSQSETVRVMEAEQRPASSPRYTEFAIGAESRSILFGKGDVWIPSYYNGIHRLSADPSGGITRREVYWIDPASPNAIANCVTCAETDRAGNIWVGTLDGIYTIGSENKSEFNTISTEAGGISHNVVSDVICDADGNIWASTSNGLNRIAFNGDDISVKHYQNTIRHASSVIDNRMQAILTDSRGTMWIGTKRGVVNFNPATGAFSYEPKLDEFIHSSGASFVKVISEDSAGNIWLGFFYGSIVVRNRDTGGFHKLSFDDGGFDGTNISAIDFDKFGNIWIGSKKNGLIRIDAGSLLLDSPVEKAGGYSQWGRTHGGLATDCVSAVFCNRDNIVYVGTSEGLYRHMPGKEGMERIRLNLTNQPDYVCGMTEDISGALWVFTTTGVYRYIPGVIPEYFELDNGAFARFDYLLGNCTDRRNRIFVGGINGVTWFDPMQVKADTLSSRVYISDFSILNREVVPDGRHIEADINSGTGVTLGPDEVQFSFEFTSLNYADPGKMKYCYRLDGFDREWVYIPRGRNYVSYSNLPPGQYTLRIRATNPMGMWSAYTRDVHIKVLPPWWQTWWSYCLFTLAALMILVWVVSYSRTRRRLHQREQLDRWKQRFFINITHGFKGPLTMLRVLLDAMSDGSRNMNSEERKRILRMMDKNVGRFSHMIDQLMEFRRLDRKNVALSLVETDFPAFVRMVCDTYMELFTAKGIELEVKSDSPHLKVTFDPEKIETVLSNLLHNAWSFTPAGGRVTVHCSVDPFARRVNVSVADTGIGIPDVNTDRIFHRFWQGGGHDNFAPAGAGIGLSLSRELVELHKGTIDVESTPGEGSVFTFRLPLGSRHFGSRRHVTPATEVQEPLRPALSDRMVRMERDVELLSDKERTGKKEGRIALTSVDGDMAGMLCYILQNYTVDCYPDTRSAVEGIASSQPQLVLLDIVPRTKELYLEMVQQIKTDPATSHIPTVLLTPGDEKEEAALFYRAGADSFIEKPFDVTHLQALVARLVQNRSVIREKARIDMILNPKVESVETLDERFVAQTMEVIEKNISNEDFSLSDFVEAMGVSRSVLHARLQALTGKSPIELMRHMRMDRAAQLLRSGAYNISQVSYMVGFYDSRYFSTSFRKQYGLSPREYMNANKGREAAE